MSSHPSSLQPSKSSYHKKLRDYLLLLEYHKLLTSCPSGIYLLPSPTLRIWYGILFIHGGYYKGIYKFKMKIPYEYPEIQPILCIENIYHPCVNEEGVVDLSIQFANWNNNKNYILLILIYLKRIFYIADIWKNYVNPYNIEAYNLWYNDRMKYEIYCKEASLLSSSKIYENENENNDENNVNLLKFNKLKPDMLEKIITLMKTPKPAGFTYLDYFLNGINNDDDRKEDPSKTNDYLPTPIYLDPKDMTADDLP